MAVNYDAIAADYAKHRHVHPGVLRALIETGPIDRRTRVLEVGCGTGNYARALSGGLGCPCYGIDPSAAMLTEARARGNTVTFRIGRAEVIPYADAVFDVVFSVDVIHHVSGRERYFGEARRVLPPRGRICTATDSEDIIRNREPLSTYFPETVPLELARYPRLADLRAMMETAGFRNIVEESVENAGKLTDIDAYRTRSFSALTLLSDDALRRGIERLEHDLARGPIPFVARYVLLWGTK